MEAVNRVRELEAEIAKDFKAVNNIVTIKKFLKREDLETTVRVAAIHSLRRIFTSVINDGKLCTVDSEKNKAAGDARTWLHSQFKSFLKILLEFVVNGEDTMQALSIRTLIQFVSLEWKTQVPAKDLNDSNALFGVSLYRQVMTALLNSQEERSAEILILLKDEVFNKADSLYFALEALGDALRKHKESISESSDQAVNTDAPVALVQNALDLLRVASVPESEEELEYLVPLSDRSSSMVEGNSDGDSDDDDDAENDAEGSHEDRDDSKKPKLIKVGKNRFTPEEYEIFLNLTGGKRPAESSDAKGKHKNKKARRGAPTSRSDRLRHLPSYRKMFSRSWFALLALPLTASQHRLVLQHLPEHVMPLLPKPLLLADYLMKSYEVRGVVAVLALESLFKLIVQHNLDYPRFFASLYQLCTVEVFTAKYRSKFLNLLSMSLKSTNLSANMVAAFIKRLAVLSLQVPSPAALFCVAQVTLLLRKHPQCMVLLHRKSSTNASKPRQVDGVLLDVYDRHVNDAVENTGAIHSSLYEMQFLESHFFHNVSIMAKSLQNAESTQDGPNSSTINIEDFIDHNYSTIIEGELKKSKKYGDLSHVPPKDILGKDSILGACFGV